MTKDALFNEQLIQNDPANAETARRWFDLGWAAKEAAMVEQQTKIAPYADEIDIALCEIAAGTRKPAQMPVMSVGRLVTYARTFESTPVDLKFHQ